MTDPTLTPEIYGPDHAHPQGLAAAKASMDAAPLTECFDRGNMPWRASAFVSMLGCNSSTGIAFMPGGDHE